jgi:hypothetical protein
MTKTFLSLPTNSAQPLLAGRIPRICTGTTSFFMRSIYVETAEKQARNAVFVWRIKPNPLTSQL